MNDAPTALCRPNSHGDGETPVELNCTACPAGEKGNGGKRPGAGRKALPIAMLRRPDLADCRPLRRARPPDNRAVTGRGDVTNE